MMAGLPSSESTKSFWHTEPSPLLLGHRSTRELPVEADVVIIGSGITGASAAWHLLHKDDEDDKPAKPLHVVMLEAREACWGATGRNGGHCQPLLYEHPSDPSIANFELANFAAIQSLVSALSIPCEFHAQPGVHAFYSRTDARAASSSLETLANRSPALASQLRFVTSTTELASLRLPTAVAAIVTQTAARMWPYKFVAHVLETLLTDPSRASGHLNLQTHTPALSLVRNKEEEEESASTWQIRTPRGAITARKVILATNGYTSALLPNFSDLIVPCRGQMSALLPPPSLSGKDRLTTSFGFLGPGQDDYLIQRSAAAPDTETGSDDNDDGNKRPFSGRELLLFGGGRGRGDGPSLGISDDSAVDAKVAKYLRAALPRLLLGEEEEDDDDDDASGEKSRSAAALSAGSEDVAGESGEQLSPTHEWTGIMGFSRDNTPFVGPVPGSPGVFLAAGYTGHGMPNAWLCGAAVAVMARREYGEEGEGIAAAVRHPGIKLPRAYVLDWERLERVRRLKTVRETDSLGRFRAEFAE